MAEPAFQYHPDEEEDENNAEQLDTRPYLKSLPTSGVSSGDAHQARGKLRSVSTTPSPEELQDKEDSSSAPTAAENPESRALRLIQGGGNQEAEGEEDETAHDQQTGFKYRAEKTRNRIRNKMSKKKKNKLFLLFGIAGGFGILGVLAVIFFLVGLLALPNFGQHITTYQFARVAKNFSESTQQIEGESFMTSTVPDGVFASLKQQFKGLSDDFWNKINQFRPDKIVSNMETAGKLDYVYGPPGLFGRQKLQAIVLDGQEIPVNNPGLIGKYLNPIDNIKAKIQFSGQLSDAVDQSLVGSNTIVRSAVARNIRDRIQTKLFRWRPSGDPKDPANPDNYNNQAQSTIDQLDEKASAAAATNDGQLLDAAASGEVAPNLQQAEANAIKSQKACTADAACLQALVDSESATGLSQATVDAISTGVRTDVLQTLTKYFSPIYALSVPLCIIYDGSLNNSQPTIDAHSAALERTFYSVKSAGDQQLAGAVSAGAVGGLVRQLGPLNQANAEIRSSATGVVNTSNYVSPQASASGSFSVLDTFLPASVTRFFDPIAGSLCPIMLNPAVGIGTGILLLIPGGLQAIIGKAADQTVISALSSYMIDFGARLVSKDSIKSFLLIGGATAAATFAAKFMVMQRAGSIHNGLNRGTSYANDADAGGNLIAQETDRGMFYGRPMTSQEVVASKIETQQYLADKVKSQSTYQRYFAISNADSLVTRFGMSLHGYINGSFFSSILSTIGKMLNPWSSLPKLFGSLSSRAAFAADTNDTADYGNVQWGWTPDETAKINSDPSLQHPLVNKQILDDSQNAAAIEKKYGQCFDLKNTMGMMLAKGWIVRDSNGNVDPYKGDCAPQKLSYNNNSEFGPAMVFRWRLAKRTDATINHLGKLQTPDQSSNGTPAPPASVNKSVYMIGDSITVGMRDQDSLQAKLTAAGLTVRQIDATTGIHINDSIPKIDADLTNVKAAGTIVVELGTNDAPGATQADISQKIVAMIQKIKSVNTSPTLQIDWMNLHSTKFDVSAANAAIQAESTALGYKVLDWNIEASTNPADYCFDSVIGVHQTTGQGYSNMSAWLAASLTNTLTTLNLTPVSC